MTPIHEVMTINCKTVSLGMLAAEALDAMETHKITALIVLDDHQTPIGVVHMHDLIQARVV
jgi:arabinose-5-phosphate isomerase